MYCTEQVVLCFLMPNVKHKSHREDIVRRRTDLVHLSDLTLRESLSLSFVLSDRVSAKPLEDAKSPLLSNLRLVQRKVIIMNGRCAIRVPT